MDFNVDNEFLEPLVSIDLGNINWEAHNEAHSVVKLLSKLYKDEEFLTRNPYVKERLDVCAANLKSLMKSKIINENLQDSLVNAISVNSGDVSLYRSLNDLQKTNIQISERIDDVLEDVKVIIDEMQDEDDIQTFRGTKELTKTLVTS